MAERGATYRQILTKYFPSTHVANNGSGLISVFSVPPQCSLCLCGECLPGILFTTETREHGGGTKNFKIADHANSDGVQAADLMWARGLESFVKSTHDPFSRHCSSTYPSQRRLSH